MEAVTRINITDPVTLRRVAVAQRMFDDKSATKTAERLIVSKLDDLNIPLLGEIEPENPQTNPGCVTGQ